MTHTVAWGEGSHAELAVGYATALSTTPLPGDAFGEGLVEVKPSGHFTLARKSNGTAWGIGGNTQGQLGVGTKDTALELPVSPALTGVTQVDTAGGHAICGFDDGMCASWGGNSFGQVGNGTVASSPESEGAALPVLLNLQCVTQVAAGGGNCGAVTANGLAFLWGENRHGQIGDGTKSDKLVPTLVPELAHVVKIAIGGLSSVAGHVLALLSDGTCVEWGNGNPAPRAVPGLTDVVDVAAGAGQSFAILSGGTLLGWGSNLRGQLGLGFVEKTALPTPVPGLSNVASVSCGFQFSLVLAGGEVYAMGRGDHGQLGLGDTEDRISPTPLEGLTEVLAVEAGEKHSMALAAGPVSQPTINVAVQPGEIDLTWESAAVTAPWSVAYRPVTKPASTWTSFASKLPSGTRGVSLTVAAGRYEVRIHNASAWTRTITAVVP